MSSMCFQKGATPARAVFLLAAASPLIISDDLDGSLQVKNILASNSTSLLFLCYDVLTLPRRVERAKLVLHLDLF